MPSKSKPTKTKNISRMFQMKRKLKELTGEEVQTESGRQRKRLKKMVRQEIKSDRGILNDYRESPKVQQRAPVEVVRQVVQYPSPPAEVDLKQVRKNLHIKIDGPLKDQCPAPVSEFTEGLSEMGRMVIDQSLSNLRRKTRLEIFKPTPIQAQIIPPVCSGLNVVGLAPTGSGKTLGFCLPLLLHFNQNYTGRKFKAVTALILSPTRELSLQTSAVLKACKTDHLLKMVVAELVGGRNKGEQVEQLESTPAQCVVGTPGRLLDLINIGVLNLNHLSFTVLDEADKLLQMGFREEIESMLAAARADNQILMFSATFKQAIRDCAETWLKQAYVLVRIGTRSFQSTFENRPSDAAPGDKPQENLYTVSPTVEQVVHVCAEHKKTRKLIQWITKVRQKEKEAHQRHLGKMLIFVKTIKTLNTLVKFLLKEGVKVGPMHGQLPQYLREQYLADFKAGKLTTLVATDLAARGLHIKHLPYVVNYDFPPSLEMYCHRVGRTGRQGAAGYAFSFFTRNLLHMSSDLVKLLNNCHQKVDPNLLNLAQAVNEDKEAHGETPVDLQADLEEEEDEEEIPVESESESVDEDLPSAAESVELDESGEESFFVDEIVSDVEVEQVQGETPLAFRKKGVELQATKGLSLVRLTPEELELDEEEDPEPPSKTMGAPKGSKPGPKKHRLIRPRGRRGGQKNKNKNLFRCMD